MKKLEQQTVITGIIMPSNWDDRGRIIEIALYTDTEEVYTVERNRLTGELMNFLHRSVEINGKISQHPSGNKTIAAQDFSPQREIFDNREAHRGKTR